MPKTPNNRLAGEIKLYAGGFVSPAGHMLHWSMPADEECWLVSTPIEHPSGNFHSFELDAFDHKRRKDGRVPGNRINFLSSGVITRVAGVSLVIAEHRIAPSRSVLPDQVNNFPSRLANYLFEGFGRQEIIPIQQG